YRKGATSGHPNLGTTVTTMAEGPNIGGDPTSTDQNFPNNEFLTKCNEYRLFQLTKLYRDRLEHAIEEVVDEISLLLTIEKHLSKHEHQKVTDLVEKGHRADSSKLLLKLVMEKGSLARSVMWESFVKMRHGVPKLDKILNEIQELGSNEFDFMNLVRDSSKVPSTLK
ncbi:hypothetical protein scyTo_0020094, partial [Scyliorhinus torazame]|nr:hypothetical protein [Scyliorhinus torazame]